MNGQFTRVTFVEQQLPAPGGVIQGVLRDQAGTPQSGRQITLTGQDISRTATTGTNGGYRFENLPAGTYTLAVAGTDVQKTVQSDGHTALSVDLTLPAAPPPTGEWHMEVTRGTGLPLLVGSLPEAGIPITITGPTGAATQVVSGSKPEYGAGGFEVYAPQTGTYTIQFLDQTFSVPMSGQFTRVTFTRTAPPQGKARLVSEPVSLSDARAWLQYFESDPKTRGLFNLEEE
jgi:hypothetical protein